MFDLENLKCFGTAAIAAGAFSATSASAVVIGAFEGDFSSPYTSINEEDVEVDVLWTTDTDASFTGFGATEGSTSFTASKAPGWGNILFLNGGTQLAADVSEYNYLALDVSSPDTAEWRQFFVVMQGDGLGWTQRGGDVGGLTPGGTATLFIDLVESGAKAAASPASTWWQLFIIAQGGDAGSPNPIDFTVDNIRFANEVPEPASLSLLALGLAAITSRRRR